MDEQCKHTNKRRQSDQLIVAVDRALNESSEPSPQGLVPIVLRHLSPADHDSALGEALRVYIELRIYERQGEPQLVRTEDHKVRENRLRRMASRQRLALHKSPRRDPQALGYGTYMLVNRATKRWVVWSLPNGYDLSLDEIDSQLSGE
jgi:hypothetical protein